LHFFAVCAFFDSLRADEKDADFVISSSPAPMEKSSLISLLFAVFCTSFSALAGLNVNN